MSVETAVPLQTSFQIHRFARLHRPAADLAGLDAGAVVTQRVAQAVLDPRLLVAALQLRSSGRASILLNYIRLLTRRGAPEATFIAVIEALRDYGVSLPGEQVVEFAAFIRQHHQQSVAEAALNAYEAKRSPTLYLLAEHTLAVLPTLRKLRAVLSLRRPYAVNDFYAALAQALARLFPHGPHRNGVWEDAGGDPSDLEASGSGSELWRSALRLVRRGQVPLQRLLEVGRYRYPDDPELQELDRLSSWL